MMSAEHRLSDLGKGNNDQSAAFVTGAAFQLVVHAQPAELGTHIVWIRTACSGSLVRVVPSADGYEVSHILGSLSGTVELSIHSALRTLLQTPTLSAWIT